MTPATPLSPRPRPPKTRRPLSAALSSPVLLSVAGLLLLFFGELPNALRWPARGLILICAALGLWKFPRESRAAAEWAGALLARALAALAARVEARAGALLRAERVLAAIAVAVALVPFALMIRDMSWSSLRTDEITSVDRYSSKGPWHVMSSYQRANNHILFNLLNSITPGAGSMHPLRARLWSFVSMTALAAAALVWLWPRSPAGAAWMIAAVCLNTYHLHLELQARAYGMVSLLAFLAAAGFARYSAEGGRRWLALLAVATVLGAYAVPYFVVFGGLLLFWLYIERPNTGRFLAGFWALCLILLLHLPVMSQILQVAGSYNEDYEPGFDDPASGWSVLFYLVPGGLPFRSIGHSAAFMTALLFTALLPAVAASRKARAGLVTSAAAVAFVAFCYLLESPPRRVAAFAVIPFAFGLIWAGIGVSSASGALRPWARAAAPLACAGLAAFGAWRVSLYEFEPTQRWREFGRALTLLYPDGVALWVDTDERNNRAYLDKHLFTVTEGGAFDLERFRSGRLVIHDANYSPRASERIITQDELTPEAVRVPFETIGGETVLWLQPGQILTINGAPDGPGRFRFETALPPSKHPRGLALLLNEKPRAVSAVSVLSGYGDGSWRPLERRHWFVEGPNLFIRLPAGSAGVAVRAEFSSARPPSARVVLPLSPAAAR